MSPNTIKIVITAVLVLHGFAHGRALLTLLADVFGIGSRAWLPARSWLFPSLARRLSAGIASAFWLPATLGFFASALFFWGTLEPGAAWRQVAIAASIISTLGIGLYPETWPGAPTKKMGNLDTIIAVVMNIAILLALLWLKWPPYDMFGK
jgi:hypothetical protein